jgi:hypothetical protein
MTNRKIIVTKTNCYAEPEYKTLNTDKDNDVWLSLELDDSTTATLIPLDDDTINDIDLKAAEERHKQIINLAEDVNKLTELFQDVHDLVVIDGQKLDQIEVNIEETKQQVEQAQEELVEAHHQQKKRGLLYGLLFTLIAGPSVGILAGVKAGLLTALGTGSATVVYDKLIA